MHHHLLPKSTLIAGLRAKTPSHPWAVAVLTMTCLSGCHRLTPVTQESPRPDQTQVCEVHRWQSDATAATCTPGQKVAFLPDRWGNEQLPILFAAVNCDLRYAVVLTNGGVTCIYASSGRPPSASVPPNTTPAHAESSR